MLQKITQRIEDLIKEIGNPYVDTLSSKITSGKMLRSKLVLAICQDHVDVVNLCAIIEMIQSASLLHDDVIDESDIRRGHPSINAIFGNKNSIMLGDIFYSKAFFELTKMDVRIAKSISNAVIELSRGEIDDVFMSETFNTDKKRYFQMLQDKTASLIAASAESAAILADLDHQKYKDYGINLGIAFQVIDDLLDITQDSSTLGKPAMNDFKEGKTTLPYIYLYEMLPEDEKKILVSYFKQNKIEIDRWLKEHFDKYHIIPLVFQEAKKYAKLAISAIEDENNKSLEEVVENMINREF
ncbi:polyprenyl synthetase family protein [Helicobacter cappadocius]|uniref:Polyprenyl synthetase family protein n=1 Tax=Helicobacter cappadocius TaxID=3063998 RepID=A0AA90PLT0_9HELI|nr:MULTISPECIES: polyprenyl synthetase family protein [unclassified Helicobacter]MDO7253586.1 polyprenyl synthetase family protein [Helicobacter sp. faydin-H75]MDP2539514.1 polyprenyl synthetase family protein [Helicobacter sp. faydin-H76]